MNIRVLTDRYDRSKLLHAWPVQVRAELQSLWAILETCPPRRVLEIGCWQGGWLYVMAGVCAPGARFIGMDIARDARREAVGEVLRREGFSLDWIIGDSAQAEMTERLRALIGVSTVDLLHIDGDHHEQAVLRDWELYSPFLGQGSVAAFHDIVNTREEVPQAWKRIRASLPTENYEITEIDAHVNLGIGVIRVKEVNVS